MNRRLLAVPFLLLGLAACGSEEPGAAPSTAASSAATAASAPGSTPATTPSSSSSASTAAPVCADVSAPAPKSPDIAAPSGSLDTGKTYVVRLDTSCGTIDIQLDQAQNPKTANSFAYLSREGYYNGTVFHRVVPGFVIQGGDPLGNGTGGPSWKTVEAPPSSTRYTKGVVAMAKAGNEATGTSGSQFFIVTGDDAGLPAYYAVAGKVVAGQDVVDLIEAQGEPGNDGPPSKPIVITSATVQER